jgi:hypothetical protein
MTRQHPHNPEYLTEERRMVVDDLCHTIPEAVFWDRVRSEREAHIERLHIKVKAAKARFDASGSPDDEAAFNDAFERWIAA